jgi:hypothetical protein
VEITDLQWLVGNLLGLARERMMGQQSSASTLSIKMNLDLYFPMIHCVGVEPVICPVNIVDITFVFYQDDILLDCTCSILIFLWMHDVSF